MQTLCECDPDISVIVPVYNLEKYLEPLLDSLKSQDLGEYNAEYIFVLNNCTDKSEEVIRQSELPCKILTCEIQGCGCARNVGFEESKGEYIWYMDGDDWLLSDTAIKDVLDRAKAEDLKILRIPFESNYFNMQYYSMVWQYLMRRDLIEKFRFRKLQPAEDDAYMWQVLLKAGYTPMSHLALPCMNKAYYYYNYWREGSNMFRYQHGENINI